MTKSSASTLLQENNSGALTLVHPFTSQQPTEVSCYFGASDGNFYALNLADGSTVWKTQVDGQNLISTVNNDNITLTTYPVQVDAKNNQVYWSFGVTQQLGTNSGDKHDQYLELYAVLTWQVASC